MLSIVAKAKAAASGACSLTAPAGPRMSARHSRATASSIGSHWPNHGCWYSVALGYRGLSLRSSSQTQWGSTSRRTRVR
jgi:hypothetical protein